MKIALIDYGAGNATSVERALHKLGAASQRVNTPDKLQSAEVLLLPGVGHYGALIRSLDENNLRAPLRNAIQRGVPFLGICLGLQALFDSSEEAPELRGLGLLPGKVTALPATVKLPHMGWNRVRAVNESRLLRGLDGEHFYFAHSYAVGVNSQSGSNSVAGICEHGETFTAVLEENNIFGTQFHPEKSGESGARLLNNFLELAR